MLKSFILVGIGGALGSMLRYGTSMWLNRYQINGFPYATLLSNLLGCLIIGILLSNWSKNSESNLQLLWIVGFCGGYTTFSTFSAENLQMWQNGAYLTLITYLLTSIIGGLLAVLLGSQLAKI
ncbi:MAG: fluoride efflux transporter CrcB [Pedobacter sp.]|nr:MAG: fluoride efflux transporter CrcB [Pedobacter sp.]